MVQQTKASRRHTSVGMKTREDILKLAVNIASAEGLEGLTIGRLAKELRMSKSGIFAHFGSKVDLQLATIETARDIFIQHIITPSASSEPGIRRLSTMLDAWLSYVESGVFRGGCFFVAASTEFDSRPGPVRDLIVELTQAWVDALVDETQQAQRFNEVHPDIDPAQFAFEVHAFVQEANWAYQLLGDKSAFERARKAIHQCLENAMSTSDTE